MGFTTPWRDASRHVTYKRGDKLVITGTVQNSADGISGTQGTFTNKTVYFYGYYTATWTVRAPICIGLSSGSAWAYITADMIKSGGTLDTYTVKYNANGGGGAPGSQTKTYGKTLKLSTTKPTRTGYSFVCWNTKSDGSGTNYASGGNYTSNSGVTLYAIWLRISYTISFDANGGTGAPKTQVKYHGTNLVLSSTIPAFYGKNFLGWAKSKTGSVAYQPGDTVTTNTNLTLYAKWQNKSYKIDYVLNGGTNSQSNPSSYTYGVGATLYNPSKVGYTFAGWKMSGVYDGGGAYAGVSVTSVGTTYTGDVTLEATWTINSYDITIDPQNGTGTYNRKIEYGETIDLGDPIFTGHTFLKWVVSGSGSVSGNTFTCGAGNATVIAQWDTNMYIVSYDANGGEVGQSFNVIEYMSPILLPSPTRKYHTFLGWFTEREGGTRVYDRQPITDNITLYAHWKNNTSVTVNNNNEYKNGYPMPKEEAIYTRGRAYVNKGGGSKTWKEGNSIE